jgi:dGTPase
VVEKEPQQLYTDQDKQREIDEALSVKDRGSHYRSAFRRDYARLIHSPSFRRLQGKTQVFPIHESDFFRNRLTHSIEVAQVAKSIAEKINSETEAFKKNPISVDVIEAAALAHDLGHPPFGHNGERALDDKLKKVGGFEGNAQTFRILARLEKKALEGDPYNPIPENRAGLNWTRRSLASIVKYDRVIPLYRDPDSKLVKGIYKCDEPLFTKVRDAVCPGCPLGKFKTIEASIMDLADDIAYSTYDLEDALKSGFLDLFDFISAPEDLCTKVAEKVNNALSTSYVSSDIQAALYTLFSSRIGLENIENETSKLKGLLLNKTAKQFSRSGYLRVGLTAELVNDLVAAVAVNVNEQNLVLSSVGLDTETALQVESLKHYTFEAMIMSPRLRVAEARGYGIINGLFEILNEKNGYLLMPEDCRHLYTSSTDDADKMRVIADFIAGMTDRYAVEFYGRVASHSPASIFSFA